jgi:UDP-glucosyltransferase 73C
VLHGLASEVERVMVEANDIVVKTFLEMESKYVVGYAEARKMKVWTVGPVSLHHRRMGTATPLALRGGVTPPPPATPS